MQIAFAKDPSDTRTRQERIYADLRVMIVDGRLRPGTRLPATRSLAAELGVSRTTVVLAFERLASEGYIESHPRLGTFVCALVPERALHARPPPAAEPLAAPPVEPPARLAIPSVPPAVRPDRPKPEFDFWIGRPDPALFPWREWREAIEAKLGGSQITDYPDPAGYPALREAIAAHVGPARGIAASAEEVIVVAGSQEGLNLVARMLGARRRVLVHEDPCYGGALEVLGRACGRRIPVAVDEHGLDTARLPDCRQGLLYLTPSHQYPLGVRLAPDRRAELLAWAQRTDSYVIEDDYDGDFCYEEAPLPALKAQDRTGRVLYLATFSKSLGAGLRLGYLIVPPPLIAAARAWKALSSMGCPWLEQAAMSELLRSGAFERHLCRIRRTYRLRRDRLVAELEAAFGPVRLRGEHGGMHLAWRLEPNQPRAEEIERRALARGVGIYGLRSAGAWASRGHPRLADTLVLSYAALSEAAIARAIERLAQLVVGSVAHRSRRSARPSVPGRAALV